MKERDNERKKPKERKTEGQKGKKKERVKE